MLTSNFLHPFAALTCSLPLIFFIFWSLCSTSSPDAPPEWTGGWPLVGHFLKFSENPVAAIREGFEKNGPVFTMSFLNRKMTFLIGTDPQVAFWRAKDEELSQNEPYKFMTPIFGKGIVFDAPADIKAQQLQFIKDAMTTTAFRSYVPMIRREAEDYFNSLGESGEIDLLEVFSQLTVRTASRCLMGDEIRERLFDNVTRLLHDIDEGISPIAIFFPNLPLPSFR
jgi:sterol 14-demethylase